MNDIISRKEAIDAIKRHKHLVADDAKCNNGIEIGYALAHDHICELLSELPLEPTVEEMRKHNADG